jgi:acylaminoacyl-peptidase
MRFLILVLLLTVTCDGFAQSSEIFEPLDVFDLEFVSDPQISPDGKQIVYVRNFKDIMTDKNLSNLWLINTDGSGNRPLTTGNKKDNTPRWSPDGKQILYNSDKDGSPQLYLHWMDSNAEAKLTNLNKNPNNLSWSPDNRWIAFTMFVPEEGKSFIEMPDKPEGATWNKSAKYIDKMKYRSDGSGYTQQGNNQVFVLSSDGGTPRQITTGQYDYRSRLCWSEDGKTLFTSSNPHPDREYDTRNSEILKIDIYKRKITQLTARKGPDHNPVVSPDGNKIAYLGYDDLLLGYQQNRLYVMNIDGSGSKQLLKEFDRNVENIQWADNGIFFQFDEEGDTKIAFTDLAGNYRILANNVGGLSLGRPYSGGTYSVSSNGNFAFTHSTWDHPSDLAVGSESSKNTRRLTKLNDDLFGHKKLGEVEMFWYQSSYDDQKIQGWICKPPDFDPSQKYPLMLEIHGGPFASYGGFFSAEVQLFAAAGYVVLYTNPRGSTGYGAEFGNKIHHNYPGQDYDDLMSGVDAVIDNGYIDEEQLYITGGSGGGVLTSWTIGKTDRFRAAVVAKPVINWYSFVLHADNPGVYAKYWFPGNPWEYLEHYMKRSPISLVGNVNTPTMLLTGESDYRTPISESEQYYTALKLNGVPASMVRIPGASHGIASKPSNLISKVLHILGWFEMWKKKKK